ncbi:NAD-dependent epimerase/dehydratase family protein [Devosia rhodophyticola]|uniref:NAD-dependent epimerase/dehydratase family protein n=1 Tax=Devosia rhodophyticola TaxID=3026423 RepID=A0ABY7YXS9_9HYPH|nr:NAD-dependent epimerase/dehydratase family protein [Devosia rhodophyticola]WDR06032.1 NAD-dependent epimerase/dehydratase family protein [Devosia rhodophyticola]
MKYFVTGSAGFIGFHLARRLLEDGHEVWGFDGVTPYYDVALKRQRLAILEGYEAFSAIEAMLEDRDTLKKCVREFQPDIIVHLAAQAGVRYSIDNPHSYADANLVGTLNLLEAARATPPRHLMLASTSSVYGGNQHLPFREIDSADHPVSLYAATKKAAEAMSHSYAHLFEIPTTCFRFFTVYGPWGRPDMALFKFVSAILAGETIDLYGEGKMRRDFTYIDDIIEAIVRLSAVEPQPPGSTMSPQLNDSLSSVAPWRVVNIAGGVPVELLDFVEAIESALDLSASKRLLPLQPGDPVATWADPSLLFALTQYCPSTTVADGVDDFVSWYQGNYSKH